ncbi:polysaccharide lyase [Billgrantia sp. LNSP4103-1]|uniref:polysaccharide lyase n=1 Tax=Billgrantia sp. LNSP4103-1 TaxID=3410266 RepID=UPI00403F58C7
MTEATQWTARATSWLLGLASLGFGLAPAHADDGEPPSTPRLSPCSERYPVETALRPSGWLEGGKDSVREDYDSSRDWGTEENALIVNPLASGLLEPALRVLYPKDSSSPSDADEDGIPRGGLGFYTEEKHLQGADRVCLHYRLRFEANFDFVKGGKLPGLYGGEAPSGGEEVTGENGYSMRLMWREDGQGELYAYLVDREGESIGRGSWSFPTGRWVTVEQELILNDPDERDGIFRVWIDGWPVLEQRNLVYRTTEELGIDGLMFSTFFGGTGEEWRTPRDQHVDFAAFRLFAFEP